MIKEEESIQWGIYNTLIRFANQERAHATRITNNAHVATLQALEGERLQFCAPICMPGGVPGSSNTRILQT